MGKNVAGADCAGGGVGSTAAGGVNAGGENIAGDGAAPKADVGVVGAAGWFCAKGFNAAPNFGAKGTEAGAGDGSVAGTGDEANAASGCEVAGCCGAMVCIAGALNAGEGGDSMRPTCPAGAPGWMTNALFAGAAGRSAASTGAGLPNGVGVAGEDEEPVSAWNTSFCGSFTWKSRFAVESVLRKPTSEMPSMSAPSCIVTLPDEICSLKVLAGMLVVIHAGVMTGLKPSSSTL